MATNARFVAALLLHEKDDTLTQNEDWSRYSLMFGRIESFNVGFLNRILSRMEKQHTTDGKMEQK